tara:strand:- start:5582 stop:6853 length:1272 start_codon:yes stop_codon:yes gene_type:complete
MFLLKIFTSLIVIFISIFISLLFIETYLYFDGRYESQINQKFLPANTINKRYPNIIEYEKHPDLNIYMPHIYDSYGIKNHSKLELSEIEQVIGFFGDSFTENRRISDEFSFTNYLNDFLKSQNIVNFGVDGFGMDQSFQNYLNFYKKFKFKKIIYVFCENDLKNLYEVNLFKINNKNELENRYIDFNKLEKTLLDYVYTFSTNFRITYLILEAYLVYQERWHPSARDSLSEKMLNRIANPSRRDYFSRYLDSNANSMSRDFLSDDPSSLTMEIAKKFLFILGEWKKHAEGEDYEFYVAVLPRDKDRLVFKKILSLDKKNNLENLNFFFLPKAKESFPSENFSSRFNYNNHWNELGNLATLRTFIESLELVKEINNIELYNYENRKIKEIIKFYKKNGKTLRNFDAVGPNYDAKHPEYNILFRW